MLYKRDEIYWTKFKAGGEIHRLSCRTGNRAAALVEAARLKVEYAQRFAGARRRQGGCHLSQLAAADLQRALAAGVDKDTRIKTLEWTWQQLLQHFGASCDPERITYDDVEIYIASRRNGRQVRRKIQNTWKDMTVIARGQTIKREIQALQRGLQIAKRRGWIMRSLDVWPRVTSDPPKAEQKGKYHPPEIIRAWLEELTPDARDSALFDVLTGLRGKELQRVQAGWVESLPLGYAVPAQLRIPAWASKTRHERCVALSQDALDILERRVRDDPGSPYVFSQKSHRRTMTSACARIGYDKNITMRDLRHTYSTIAMHGTADAIAVQAMMGHSNLSMTMKYQSATLARTAAAGAAVAAAISNQEERDALQGPRNKKTVSA